MSLGITAAPKQKLPDYTETEGAEGGPVQHHRWSPYNDNGGSTVAIAGENYAIVASDTRLTDGGYGILSRNVPKLFNLTDHIVLGATGCWADVLTLTRLIGARTKMFKFSHNATIRTKEMSQMLSNMLYAKRFFPYSVTNILAGLNEEGKGVIYGYDPVGCVEELQQCSGGAGVTLMQSLLDNQVDKKNMDNVDDKKTLTLEEAERLIYDCFVSAAERQIHVGDGICMRIVTKDGIEEKFMALRRD